MCRVVSCCVVLCAVWWSGVEWSGEGGRRQQREEGRGAGEATQKGWIARETRRTIIPYTIHARIWVVSVGVWIGWSAVLC